MLTDEQTISLGSLSRRDHMREAMAIRRCPRTDRQDCLSKQAPRPSATQHTPRECRRTLVRVRATLPRSCRTAVYSHTDSTAEGTHAAAGWRKSASPRTVMEHDGGHAQPARPNFWRTKQTTARPSTVPIGSATSSKVPECHSRSMEIRCESAGKWKLAALHQIINMTNI